MCIDEPKIDDDFIKYASIKLAKTMSNRRIIEKCLDYAHIYDVIIPCKNDFECGKKEDTLYENLLAFSGEQQFIILSDMSSGLRQSNEKLIIKNRLITEYGEFNTQENDTNIVKNIINHYPLNLQNYKGKLESVSGVSEVVDKIINQFKHLFEKRDLWKEMWDSDFINNRNEKTAQRLFYAVADSYCQSNNLDITPEADTGNGTVDFKVSSGLSEKVLVELKLSTGNVVHGYEKQLEIYKSAEKTNIAYFVIIDIGKIGGKVNKVLSIKEQREKQGQAISEVHVIDAKQRVSASKRV